MVGTSRVVLVLVTSRAGGGDEPSGEESGRRLVVVIRRPGGIGASDRDTYVSVIQLSRVSARYVCLFSD